MSDPLLKNFCGCLIYLIGPASRRAEHYLDGLIQSKIIPDRSFLALFKVAFVKCINKPNSLSSLRSFLLPSLISQYATKSSSKSFAKLTKPSYKRKLPNNYEPDLWATQLNFNPHNYNLPHMQTTQYHNSLPVTPSPKHKSSFEDVEYCLNKLLHGWKMSK